ncbi:MAG TPA: carboxypeptidase regulatory-like domain-containing protein [Candidatus Acidoferrales bacterium]|nr:carboxypeptidase regulatory-like domain-containing protein [Candidatus Acidoferrales bacterium]
MIIAVLCRKLACVKAASALRCTLPVVAVCICVLPIASQPTQSAPAATVTIRVVDENEIAVPSALVTVTQANRSLQLRTDYSGRCQFQSQSAAPYQITAEKPGHYRVVVKNVDPQAHNLDLTLPHEQQVRQEVNVVETPPAIDPEQTAEVSRMNTPDIDNIPYPTSRDIRNILPFNPGVVQDQTGQVHVAGSNTFQTKDLLDGFNITSPVSGALAMRFSPEAVRTIEVQSTRYPVEYGQTTGGVIAFRSGMGDDRFRFNVTNFIPSLQDKNGITFDKFVPRVTFSGPISKGKAWFFDAAEMEYDNTVITELPSNADNNHVFQASNLAKAQINLTSANVLTLGLLLNDYHSPYEGLGPLTPQISTVDRNTIAGTAYVRDQQTFSAGAVLEVGLAAVRFRDSYEPHGASPFFITPEAETGSFFESLEGHSHRIQQTADLYLPPKEFAGRHNLKLGLDLNEITYDQNATRAPANYLREDGTLLRRSTFAPQPYYSKNNFEFGTYIQDRWSAGDHLLIEPGLRFDRDQIVSKGLFSPRIAGTYVPRKEANTKISAGIGIYYDHTQLEYIERAYQSARTDQYFAADGVTPTAALLTNFALPNSLHEPRVLNWSVAFEQELPASIYLKVNFTEKRGRNGFVYLNQNPVSFLSGTYLLTNQREDKYDGVDISLRRTFSHGYTLFGAYTRSSARTNNVLEYYPTISILGPQGSGPLPWDAPNRLISWGWLPVPRTKRLDFVYSVEWRTGFAFSAVDANHVLVGSPNSYRFPTYVSFNPGLELRFHLGKYYLGLRGVLENATSHQNPLTVNNVVDSPQFLTFSNNQGRALTARIRIIGTK